LSSDPTHIESGPLELVIRTVSDVLEGRDEDLGILDSPDRAIRQAVATELLAASLDADVQKQHRARELFFKHGYFDQAVRNLRDAKSATDRASAAQSLGILGSRLATTPLIAALFDPDSEVREAATAALTQIQDPSVVIGPAPELTDDERKNLLEPETSAMHVHDLTAEETRIRQNIATLQKKLDELTSERTHLERLVQLSATREAKFRAEALELRGMEAAAATRADAEKAKGRQAEKELVRLSDSVSGLQREIESLSRAAADLKRDRTKVEAARLEEAERARTAAQKVYDAELARLADEERRLDRAREEVAQRRADLEQAQQETEKQAVRAAEIEKRVTELSEIKKQKKLEEKKLLDEEALILQEFERLTSVEAEVQKRIEQAGVKLRSSEEAQRQAEETAIRIEAEAHLRALEEEHALAKLESIRRTVASEVQSRADQEKRIREEIAELQQLAEEERRRLDDETQRRIEAETLLQQERERFMAEASARLKAEAEYERLREQSQAQALSEEVESIEAPDVEILGTAPLVVEDLIAASSNPDAIRADLLSEDPSKRALALSDLVRLEGKEAYNAIVSGFDDQSSEVRNAAALALLEIDEERPVEWFTRAFEEASAERRQNIGLAIAGSGVAAEAVNSLSGGTREDTYNALCVLFLMAKTGEVEPLVTAIEHHKDLEVRRAAIRLLTLSGQSEIADAAVKRRLNGFPSPTVT
jgi:HEAT repeat protein